MAGFDPRRLPDINGRWAIRGGTRALVDAIRHDRSTEIRIGAPVTAVSRDERGVSVRTTDGDVDAATAVVAVPINAIASIAFEPPLSPTKREAFETGLAGAGVKVWARIASGFPPVLALAPDRFPLSLVETQGPTPDGGTAIVAFGPSSATLSLADEAGVARAIEELLPSARVDEVGGHDWVADPFARETWATFAPGTWLRWLPGFASPEGRLVAGSDVAIGGLSYIEGAVETGLRAAREIGSILP